MENYEFVNNEIVKREKIFFLCGVKFKDSKSDKRRVLKKHITSMNDSYKVIILEENFVFKKNNKGYLAYDDIFMSNLKQVEMLTALYSDFVFIIHESNSTSAELGMFATDKLLLPKIVLLVPDEITIEENKINNFIKLAFLKNEETQKENIKKIVFNPTVEVWKKSKNKIDYRTFFLNNRIGENLSQKINEIIFSQEENRDKVIIKKNQFNKDYGNQEILSYYIEEDILNVKISPQILRTHIISLFNIEEFKNNLRKAKKINKHVTYIEKVYKNILKETIYTKEGKIFNSMKITIAENDINIDIDIRQAIGYYIYLLQAINWISLQQDENDQESRKVSISMEFEKIYKEYKGFISEKGSSLFGKEFKSE